MGKKNILYLAGVLVVCALIFSSIKFILWLSKPKEMVIKIEPDRLMKISMLRSVEGNLNFIRAPEKWKVYISTEKIYPADDVIMRSLIDALTGFKLTDIISEDKDSWSKFQLDDNSGVTIKYYYEDKDKPAGLFVIGKKLGYSPDYCYFRLPEKPEIWLSFGLKRYLFEKDIDYWRNKTIFSFDKKKLKEIEIFHPAETVKVIRKDKNWYVGDRKVENIEEGRGFDLFLYNASALVADGLMPEKKNIGKVDFRIKVQDEDSKTVEAIFGFAGQDNKCPIEIVNSEDKTPLFIYEYKVERYKKRKGDLLNAPSTDR